MALVSIPQYHERIFRPVQTLQPRGHIRGSGMGFAFVKKTVEYRGGTIQVNSSPEMGKFYFTWPKHVK